MHHNLHEHVFQRLDRMAGLGGCSSNSNLLTADLLLLMPVGSCLSLTWQKKEKLINNYQILHKPKNFTQPHNATTPKEIHPTFTSVGNQVNFFGMGLGYQFTRAQAI